MNIKQITAGLLSALALAIAVCGCAAQENNDTSYNSHENTTVENTDENAATSPITVVDTDNFVPLLLNKINIDLTGDNTADNISIYLIGDSEDDLAAAESLVEHDVRMIQVLINDGTTQDILYDRTFSIDHVGEGILALVTDGTNHYLLEGSCNEQMGYATYYGEVFDWKNGEKAIVDEFHADFLISMDAICRNMEQDENVTLREDAIPDFQTSVERWNQGSELLVVCDTVNSLNEVKSIYVNQAEKQYSLDDFFSTIWERETGKFTVGTFDNIMGYAGFYIYDETWFFPYGYFYAIEDGQSFCIAENWGCSEDDNYIIDIDNDGENELICNVMFGDGVESTLVYRRDGSDILVGYADELLDHEYDYIGIGSLGTRYLPDENVVEIYYWKEKLQDYETDKYRIDFEKIGFYPFEPQP
ncbi:MAG: hypothetical protein NC433_02680 [Clostridiales bacterium]|nr:hypothetical protein [Clostridiales bacterium]